MRRIALWMASTVTAVVLLFGYHTSTSGPGALSSGPPPIVGSVSSSSSTSSTSSTSSSSTDTTPATPQKSSTTVTGDAADTRYGPVQVSLTVEGSSIVSVQVPQYPSSDGQDLQINSYALPILVQETLDAQSSSIDMVSGATFTSQGYQQSLQSALDQAGV